MVEYHIHVFAFSMLDHKTRTKSTGLFKLGNETVKIIKNKKYETMQQICASKTSVVFVG